MIKRLNPLTLLYAVIAVSCLIYLSAFRLDRFGYYRDDSMYVVMAKALATNEGYRIMSLPAEPVQAKSPPFYPFLLSLIWRAYPDFPGNVGWMVLLTIAATACSIALAWRYLVKHRYAQQWQALIVVILVGLNWRTVVLAGGVYSEMIYAVLSLGALYLAEEYEKDDRRRLGIAVGALVGLAFLTRSAGIALLPAMAIYYWIRRLKRGWLPVAAGTAIVVAWLAWGALNPPRTDDVSAGFYESYLSTFGGLIGGEGSQGLVAMIGVISRIIGTNAIGLVFVSIPVVCLGLNYATAIELRFGFPLIAAGVLLLIAAGFLRTIKSGGLRLMHAYLLSYIAVHLVWPYTAYDRFLMPILPFLLYGFVIEAGALWHLVRDTFRLPGQISKKLSAALIGLIVLGAISVTIYTYGSGLVRATALSTINKDAGPSVEDAEAIEWIRNNTNEADVLVCYRDPLYYLHTGRKATRSVLSREGGLLDVEGSVEEMSKAFLRILKDSDAKYLIATESDFELESRPEVQRGNLTTILQQNPQVFVPMFRASDGGSAVFRIDSAVIKPSPEL